LPSPVNGSHLGGVSPRMSLGGLSPGQQQISGVSPSSSSRFSSPGHQMGSASPYQTKPSPAYTLLCPSSQKLIIRKVKKKKKKAKGKESGNLDTTPCSSSAFTIPKDETENENDTKELREIESQASGPGLSLETAQLPDGHTMCVGDVVWGKGDSTNPWWPGKILNLLKLDERLASEDDNRAHAQISWYTSSTSTSSTSILPCSDVKPFLESYESLISSANNDSYKEAISLAMVDARQSSTSLIAGLTPSPSQSPREIMV